MKIKFLQDYGKYKAGAVVEVSEAEAEEHHQAGRAYPYIEPEKPAPKSAKAKK